MNSIKRKKPAEDLIHSLVEDLKKDAADATNLLPTESPSTPAGTSTLSPVSDPDEKTIPVAGAPKPKHLSNEPVTPKVSYGAPSRGQVRGVEKSGPSSHLGADAQLHQAENLRLAQKRILDLERHLEKMRTENEQLASVADVAKTREEELLLKIQNLERSRADIRDQGLMELNIYKDNYQEKEFEVSRLKIRVEELEGRLQADLKKIRVRERELENRLELSKVEKNALLKAKDETILEAKRKEDQLYSEIEMYKQKCIELNNRIETNNEQFSRTVRALRLALTNLEANEGATSINLAPLKKAE